MATYIAFRKGYEDNTTYPTEASEAMNQPTEISFDLTGIANRTQNTNRVAILFPTAIIVVALAMAILHMVPFWHAQAQTPVGWTFTQTLSASPDYMQYRIWARRSQITGPLVDNTFTTEPNKPYLPVVFYYGIGVLAHLTGFSVEFIYAYAGMVLAFGFTILLFLMVRQFFRRQDHLWWVFFVILLGGGIAAHLKLLTRYEFVKTNLLLRRVIVEPIWNTVTLNDVRGTYPIFSLFDTHFLMIWSVVTAAILALYLALQKFSWPRIVLVGALYGATTIIHLYEGVTLLAITAAVVLFCWYKGLLNRAILATVGIASSTVVLLLLWQLSLFLGSGLPLPTWHEPNVLFSVLFIGYPVAWVVLAWGLSDFWRQARLRECFLLGWVLGCTTLVLAGPFYPYPIRGTMTLQIPLYISAGLIYFSRYQRITFPIAVIIFVLVGATPLQTVQNQWEYSTFTPDSPVLFLTAEHRDMIDLLRQRALANDVLLVDKTNEDWETDDLWLAPDYPGRLYCGHFFLTVDYIGKRAEVIRFFRSDPDEQAAFLAEKQIRFLYVSGQQDPQRFTQVPGLVLLKAASIGSLFEYTGEITNAG